MIWYSLKNMLLTVIRKCKCCPEYTTLIYILYTRVHLCFLVHKLEKFSPNPGKVNFEDLVHLLKYIKDSNNLGLKYYSKRKDSPISHILRQAIIKTENQFMVL